MISNLIKSDNTVNTHWLDKIVDGPKAKIIACIPIISSIILGSKKSRYEKIMKDPSSNEARKIEALRDMHKFTLTIAEWGNVQLIATAALAIFLIAPAAILFPVPALTGVAVGGVIGAGILGIGLAIQINHWSVIYLVNRKKNEEKQRS